MPTEAPVANKPTKEVRLTAAEDTARVRDLMEHLLPTSGNYLISMASAYRGMGNQLVIKNIVIREFENKVEITFQTSDEQVRIDFYKEIKA